MHIFMFYHNYHSYNSKFKSSHRQKCHKPGPNMQHNESVARNHNPCNRHERLPGSAETRPPPCNHLLRQYEAANTFETNTLNSFVGIQSIIQPNYAKIRFAWLTKCINCCRIALASVLPRVLGRKSNYIKNDKP